MYCMRWSLGHKPFEELTNTEVRARYIAVWVLFSENLKLFQNKVFGNQETDSFLFIKHHYKLV